MRPTYMYMPVRADGPGFPAVEGPTLAAHEESLQI